MVLTDKQAPACGGLSVYTKSCTPSILDLANLPPSRTRNHGEKRIQLLTNDHTRQRDLPIFPMPISWIHSMFGGRKELDGSLPILCGRAQSGRGGANLLNSWNVVPVPTYSQDALRFHLGDNRAVADSNKACEDILYATCGFGRLVQKYCNDSLTVEKAAGLRQEAENGFARSLETFYEEIGLSNVLPSNQLRRIEAALTYINNEQRTQSLLDDVNEMTSDAIPGQDDLDHLDLLFMQWMGLLREGANNKWVVPPLYARLIKH